MNFKLFLLIPFFCLLNSSEDDAVFWGKNGHRATGKIAEMHLTKKQKRK